jgi:hypothetical protein
MLFSEIILGSELHHVDENNVRMETSEQEKQQDFSQKATFLLLELYLERADNFRNKVVKKKTLEKYQTK